MTNNKRLNGIFAFESERDPNYWLSTTCVYASYPCLILFDEYQAPDFITAQYEYKSNSKTKNRKSSNKVVVVSVDSEKLA